MNENIGRKLALRDPLNVDVGFRDAFMIHASLSEIVLDFGTLDKGANPPEGGVLRERVAMSLGAAVQFSDALAKAIDEIKRATLEMAAAQGAR